MMLFLRCAGREKRESFSGHFLSPGKRVRAAGWGKKKSKGAGPTVSGTSLRAAELSRAGLFSLSTLTFLQLLDLQHSERNPGHWMASLIETSACLLSETK